MGTLGDHLTRYLVYLGRCQIPLVVNVPILGQMTEEYIEFTRLTDGPNY
jgi:hypothetical protein